MTIYPFPFQITPMANITGMTYQDGTTYVRELVALQEYINTTLIGEVNDVFADAAAQYQSGLANAEQTVTEAKTEWDERYDAFIANFIGEVKALNESAVAGMVAGPGPYRTALDAVIDAEISVVTELLEGYVDDTAATLRAETTTLAATLRDETADLATDLRGETAAGLASVAQKEAAHLEYSDDFTQRPDGVVTKALTGQDYSFLGPAITISNGAASFPNTSEGGAYASVHLDGDAVWLGGEFRFTPYSTDGGLAVFAATEEDIKATQDAGQGLPRMSMHLSISPKEITVDVLTSKGGSVTRLWAHPFTTELASDDTTVYSAWAAIDRKNGVAYIIDPTGEVHSIAHVGFKIPSRWVFFEPFRTLGTPLDKTRARFHRVQADSRDTARPSLIAPLARHQVAPVIKEVYPNGIIVQSLTTAQQPITGTLSKITVPSTGKVRARVTAFIDITSTAVGGVMFNLVDAAGTGVIDARSAGNRPDHSGWTSVEFIIPGLTAGSIFTAQFSATALGGATASLIYGTDASTARYGINFTLEPVA